jgi:hypothetical protein
MPLLTPSGIKRDWYECMYVCDTLQFLLLLSAITLFETFELLSREKLTSFQK